MSKPKIIEKIPATLVTSIVDGKQVMSCILNDSEYVVFEVIMTADGNVTQSFNTLSFKGKPKEQVEQTGNEKAKATVKKTVPKNVEKLSKDQKQTQTPKAVKPKARQIPKPVVVEKDSSTPPMPSTAPVASTNQPTTHEVKTHKNAGVSPYIVQLKMDPWPKDCGTSNFKDLWKNRFREREEQGGVYSEVYPELGKVLYAIGKLYFDKYRKPQNLVNGHNYVTVADVVHGFCLYYDLQYTQEEYFRGKGNEGPRKLVVTRHLFKLLAAQYKYSPEIMEGPRKYVAPAA